MNPIHWTFFTGLAAALATGTPHMAMAQSDFELTQAHSVLTQHQDNFRTGFNSFETQLTTNNVNARHFGKLFTRAVDGDVYAQILYLPNLVTSDGRSRNVFFVATEHNSIYAFDADDATRSDPLWKTNLGPSVQVKDAPFDNSDCKENGRRIFCNIQPEIGITSTPVIDPDHQLIYTVAAFRDFTRPLERQWHQDLIALNLRDGRVAKRVEITAEVSAHGDGMVDGSNENVDPGAAARAGIFPGHTTVRFDPIQHLQRPGLLLTHNGLIVFAFSAHADNPPYFGWVMAYDAASLRQVGAYVTTAEGGAGGIWQSGQGLTEDREGGIYALTGNGSTDKDDHPVNLASSAIKLGIDANGIRVDDWFTPMNVDYLNQRDQDLGSSGILMIPGTDFIIGGGKEGALYLVDRKNLGRFSAQKDQVLQKFKADPKHKSGFTHIHGSPVYWGSPSGPRIFVWGESCHLTSFEMDLEKHLFGSKNSHGQFEPGLPISTSKFTVPDKTMPGAFLSVSSNRKVPGTAIVWATHNLGGSAELKKQPGILRAFDASDLTRELWNSDQAKDKRDQLGFLAKFNPPTVANGKVFAPTFSNQVITYGLLGH